MLTLKTQSTYFVDTAKPHASLHLSKLLIPYLRTTSPIIFLCIGTDRTTGDCLGPLVGMNLAQKPLPDDIYVYGTIDHPVHARNLVDTINKINSNHKNPYIVAIDASLGIVNHIGYITLSNEPLTPGAGVKKALPKVGDISITGIVNNSSCGDGFMTLQSTRLSIVMNMADSISDGIYQCIEEFLLNEKRYIYN